MVASIAELIAGINPDLYYDGDKKEIKKLISEKGISGAMDYLKSKGKEIKTKSETEHTLVYDSSSETLEPV
ncbi:MAG: hypothetical protein AABX29_10110, partial [Nanoarchaeota archaeon]